jgi:CheY-like chemotaxis protein
MPIMDGFQASIAIKELYRDSIDNEQSPYICALTAYSTQGFK